MDPELEAQLRALEEESNSLFAEMDSFKIDTKTPTSPVSRPVPAATVPAKPPVASKPAKLTQSPSSEGLSAIPTSPPAQRAKIGGFSYTAAIPQKTYTPLKAENELDDAQYQRLKADMDRKKEEEARRLERERKQEEDPENALRMLEEQLGMMQAQTHENSSLKKSRDQAQENNVNKSLEDIMQHAQKIEDQRKREQQEAENIKREQLLAVKEGYAASVKTQNQEFVTALKLLLTALGEINPGKYFQSAATIVTAAHGFLDITDAISEDMHFEQDFRNDIKKLTERMLEKIKSLVEAAKAAVRDHPNQASVETLRKEALELAQLVKDLTNMTKV